MKLLVADQAQLEPKRTNILANQQRIAKLEAENSRIAMLEAENASIAQLEAKYDALVQNINA